MTHDHRPRPPALGDLFPASSPEAIALAVAAWWDLAGPLPVPRRPMVCPFCQGPAYPRAWSITPAATVRRVGHDHRLPWRADVSMKCWRCSAVWPHGLAITADDASRFGANPGHREAAAYTWREARDRLAGYLGE